MFVMGNFLNAVAYVVNMLLTAMSWLIIIRAVSSWFSPDPFNSLVQFLNRVTEPILEPIRRLLPAMSIDLSPLIVLVSIHFLRIFLVGTLYDLASRMH
jgi:YggT family protein